MKLIKIAFLIALFNFIMLGAVVMALKKPNVPISTAPIVANFPIPTEVPTVIPTVKPKPKSRVVANNPDPFAAIFSQPQPSQSPNSQPNNPTSAPQTVQPTTAPVVDNRCIITIDGGRYDVTSFRNQHSGGDIFQCGADMSATFHNRHPNSFLNQLTRI
ncbi:MAG: hypothetical protein WAV41_01735 [Microgenomates group bacterium]